ncbi:MAG TPA: ABC transporter ATP-binding protein [Armatimonadota bacterium]|nr:ABC transporter ATP-binding protein [Armatimonadota bacterium]
MPMLRTVHLRKEYDKTVAVKDLNLELDTGDIFGFIGPNGAGKTTTIKMLATLLQPTSGSAFIDGIDVTQEPEAIRSVIGYMPDFFGVYDDMRVWEYLDFFAAAYKIPSERRPKLVSDVLELTDLVSKRDNFVEELSRGMKQRLCLAKTLVHDPKVLLLDEPASGLDPRARIEIKELLRELKAMGKTILISSHILPELADFCTKVGIIEQGQMVVCGSVSDIMREVTGGKTLIVKAPGQLDEVAAVLADQPGVRRAVVIDGAVRVEATPEIDNATLIRALFARGLDIQSFSEQDADLEDIFLKVTRGAVA